MFSFRILLRTKKTQVFRVELRLYQQTKESSLWLLSHHSFERRFVYINSEKTHLILKRNIQSKFCKN